MNDLTLKLNDKIRKNISYVLLGKLLTPVVTFLITGYIVRHISIDSYGIYNILLAVMGYIGLFSAFGLLNIFQRYIPDFFNQKEYSHIKLLVRYGCVFRFVLIGLCVGLMILFSRQMGQLFKINGYYFKLFSLGIIFALEAELIGLSLTSLFLHKYFVIAHICYIWGRAIVLYFLLKNGGNLNVLLLCEVAMYGFLFMIQGYFYFSQFEKKLPTVSHSSFPVKRILRYGSFSYFNEMGEQVLDVSTDFIVISLFLNVEAVALYAIANQIMRLLSKWMPHQMLMDIITPTFFTRYSQKKNQSDLVRMFHLLFKFVAFFYFPMFVGIVMLGDWLIIHFFDPKYLDALHVMYVVASFTLLNAFDTPLGLMVQSIEKVEIHFIGKIFSIYNLIGDLLVVKTYGIIGVALVTGSAVLFKNMLTYFYLKKYISFSIQIKPILTIVLNSIAMGIVVYLLRPIVDNKIFFLLSVFLGIVVYLSISSVNRSFNEDERQIINKMIGKRLFIF